MTLNTLKIRHLSPQKVPFNYEKKVRIVMVNNSAYINKNEQINVFFIIAKTSASSLSQLL